MLTPSDYESVLEDSLAELGDGDDRPVVICGMAGSAQGWCVAPYLDLPADITTLASYTIRAPSRRRDVRILPGCAQRNAEAPDVMRGEETLLYGAVLKEGLEGTICIPGTHAKWVTVKSQMVTQCATSMTGEIFALLAADSTLAHFMPQETREFVPTSTFADAVAQAIKAPESILNALFSIRARSLLMKDATSEDALARLSGLLIGLEIAGMKTRAGSHVALISHGILAQSYAQALSVAGINHELYDADDLTRAGLYYAAQSLWPHIVQ